MPSSRPPRLRRPALMVCALLVGLVGLLLGPPSARAAAYPFGTDAGPVLTLPDDAAFVVGRPGDAYVIEADGDPPTITVGALPPGLKLVGHGDGSATVAGTPTGPPGTFLVEVRVHSATGASAETLTVVVQQPPVFIDRGPLDFGAGQFGRVVVRTAGYPAPGIGLEGDLPAGLVFVDNGDGTATISGTPLTRQTVLPVTLRAVNVVSDASLTTTVRVVVRPDVPGGPVIIPQPTGPQPQR